jgi:hypothetical protein
MQTICNDFSKNTVFVSIEDMRTGEKHAVPSTIYVAAIAFKNMLLDMADENRDRILVTVEEIRGIEPCKVNPEVLWKEI